MGGTASPLLLELLSSPTHSQQVVDILLFKIPNLGFRRVELLPHQKTRQAAPNPVPYKKAKASVMDHLKELRGKMKPDVAVRLVEQQHSLMSGSIKMQQMYRM